MRCDPLTGLPLGLAYRVYSNELVDSSINVRYGEAVKAWEHTVIEHVGHRDDGTLEVAQLLDRLHRQGHDAGRLLTRALARGPLPEEYASTALAYRIRSHLTPKRETPDTPRRGVRTHIEPPRPMAPPSQGPGIGL